MGGRTDFGMAGLSQSDPSRIVDQVTALACMWMDKRFGSSALSRMGRGRKHDEGWKKFVKSKDFERGRV
jgi:hypothetical protein